MEKLRGYLSFFARMGLQTSLEFLRMRAQLGVYWVWCKISRQDFTSCPYGGEYDDSEPGKYVVTRGIPGFGVTVFGKTIWIVIPMALKYERVAQPGIRNSSKRENPDDS